VQAITITLFLLVAVSISRWLSRALPFPLPLPLVQIGLGALIAWGAGSAVRLDPQVFFLLFLPPLLFLDGWRIRKEGLLRDRQTILELAVGLVVFTVVGVGFLLHWLVPSMPLPVAFALAAVVSPTDPIAVSAIAARTPIPARLMHILEGESLLNDASGLVCMRFAVAAALTGTFSLASAIGAFFWLALGGLAIGIGVTLATTSAKDLIARRLGEEPAPQALISLLIPFGAYLLAERLHCSGIVAAVAAGITMSYAEQTGRALAVTRVRRTGMWDTVQFAANGVIFVLLGEQLPSLVKGAAQVARDAGHSEPVWLLAYVIAINVVLVLLRFIWVWTTMRLTWRRWRRRDSTLPQPGWRLIAVASLAGVRGAVTLAGVLTLPLVMNDGTPFPARDLAIFLAAGAILGSLLLATFGLPVLLNRQPLPAEVSPTEEEDRGRIASAEAAIRAIQQFQHDPGGKRGDADLYVEASVHIMDIYRRRLDAYRHTGEEAGRLRQRAQIERDLQLTALKSEREEIFRLARSGQLPDDLARKLVREIDLLEARLVAG
jgi:monovalent cation/hydrogen antiporter